MDFEHRGERYDDISKDYNSEIPKGSQDCQGRAAGSLRQNKQSLDQRQWRKDEEVGLGKQLCGWSLKHVN